jgi:tripartite-type tricarboxylate transporter receptor subunit TctC
VLAALSKAVMEGLAKPAVAANAVKQGIAVNVQAPDTFKVYLAAELKKWAAVVKQAQVKVD